MNPTTEVMDWVTVKIEDAPFRDFLAASLVEFCSIDSTPGRDVAELRRREQSVFGAIRTIALREYSGSQWQECPINNEALSGEESYTAPYYTDSATPYVNRFNTVMLLPGDSRSANAPSAVGGSLAVNAHIDTVHPHVAPEIRGARVLGRGACDDKGNIVVMLGALRLLAEIKRRFAVAPARDVVFMFVIDEESGGNGSLALALDRELKRHYQELVVLECCDNTVYCANRGAVWYRIELPPSLVETPVKMAAELVLALEVAGRQIKDESDHPLFIDRPVQTCHGIWGPWGEHPSRVCGYVEISVQTTLPEKVMDEAVSKAVQRYTALYGDKSRVSRDGNAVVPWHYQIERIETGFIVRILGSTGHMAAVAQNDGALTKAAYVVDALTWADPDARIDLVGHDPEQPLILEGGQSFIPTHSLQAVKQRIWGACAQVLGRIGIADADVRELVTMNKLHNSAFCSDPDAPLFLDARRIAAAVGLPQNPVPQGWGASCDARLFAEQYPQLPIITMGAGDLNNAHSDAESVGIDEVARNAGLLALLILQRSGAFGAT